MPLGSWNQLGPVIPIQARTALTTPVWENRNSQRIVIATDEVTEGK